MTYTGMRWKWGCFGHVRVPWKELGVTCVGGLKEDTQRLLGRFWSSETAVMTTAAMLVGLGAGFGAVVFRWLIAFFSGLAFGQLQSSLSFMGDYSIALVPAIGGLIVGPLIYFFAQEARGHGVPEVMEAVTLRGGRIRPIVALIKSLASSICIGTGGSVGREGPIVQIGSALGSTLGQLLRRRDSDIRTLVACGAAGGIAGTFNAPIAGVIFALEVILRELSVKSFSMVVISAVIAGEVGHIVLGNFAAFDVPSYALASPWELPFYGLLGILAALAGLVFMSTLYKLEDVFDAWKMPDYVKPGFGGLALGILALFTAYTAGFPAVFGVGYETIEEALAGRLTTTVMIGLVFAKVVATSLTLGSGGSGGVFAPSLFVGAVLGGAFGSLVHAWLPDLTGSPGAYALVGMAAVFAGVARAPITAIIILFEMTQDYYIILPLMLSTGVATLVSWQLQPHSIYTLKLVRRGIDIDQHKVQNLMRSIRAEQAMTPLSQLVSVRPDTSFEALTGLFRSTHSHGFAVLDGKDDLSGIVALSDLEEALRNGKKTGTVREICTTQPVTAFPDEPLENVVHRIERHEIGRIPVVHRVYPRRLLGMIHRADVIHAYSRAQTTGLLRLD